jgi:hypothetical protein
MHGPLWRAPEMAQAIGRLQRNIGSPRRMILSLRFLRIYRPRSRTLLPTENVCALNTSHPTSQVICLCKSSLMTKVLLSALTSTITPVTVRSDIRCLCCRPTTSEGGRSCLKLRSGTSDRFWRRSRNGQARRLHDRSTRSALGGRSRHLRRAGLWQASTRKNNFLDRSRGVHRFFWQMATEGRQRRGLRQG